MSNLSLSLACLLSILCAKAQENLADTTQAKHIGVCMPQKLPQFVGGHKQFIRFMQDNLRRPRQDVKGRVFVRFLVGKDGKISEAKVIKGIPDCPECDAEAIRLINSMPDWEAGELNDEKKSTYYTLPIIFD